MNISSKVAMQILNLFQEVDDGKHDVVFNSLVRPIREFHEVTSLLKEITSDRTSGFVDSRLVWRRCADHLGIDSSVFSCLNRKVVDVDGVPSHIFFQAVLSPKSLEDLL